MKRSTSIKAMAASAAVTGFIAGLSATSVKAAPVAFPTQSNVASVDQALQTNIAGQVATVAFGDASCKGAHGCKGENACKGQGGCKTGDNGCKGKNSCKGHGGCKSEGPATNPA